MTDELKELIRVLKVHPDVYEAIIETRDGKTYEVKYREELNEWVCCRTEWI